MDSNNLPRRKLAAILAADVVGFSRMMGENENRTLTALKACRSITDQSITQNHGRIFTTAGDSVIAEFASPVDAMLAAIDFQKQLSQRNQALSPSDHMQFRVGLNLGDVIVEGDNLYGDGVNVAARIESTCVPGGITVSAKFHEEVRRKMELTFEDLGEQTMKNIEDPVATYRVHFDGVTAPLNQHADGSYPLPRKAMRRYGSFRTDLGNAFEATPGSIAVMLLKNLSSDNDQAYFCEGLSEDLVSVLSRYKSLQVASSSASFAFSEKSDSIEEIGKKLAVRYILSGSIRKMGHKIRASIKLENAQNSQIVWSENFDTHADDIFDFQEMLAATVATKLVGHIESDELLSTANTPPDDVGAYDLVLRGLKHHRLAESSSADAEKALEYFTGAVERDPGYARAHAWRACALATNAQWQGKKAYPNWRARCEEWVSTALRLDANDAEANRIMGSLCSAKGDYDAALAHLKHACDLCPSDPYISYKYASVLISSGLFEKALAEVERSKRLNPTVSDQTLELDGFLKFWNKNYDACIAELKRIREPTIISQYYLVAANSNLGEGIVATDLLEKIELKTTTAWDFFKTQHLYQPGTMANSFSKIIEHVRINVTGAQSEAS